MSVTCACRFPGLTFFDNFSIGIYNIKLRVGSHPVPGRPWTRVEAQTVPGTGGAVLGLQPSGEGADLLFRNATFCLISLKVASDS